MEAERGAVMAKLPKTEVGTQCPAPPRVSPPFFPVEHVKVEHRARHGGCLIVKDKDDSGWSGAGPAEAGVRTWSHANTHTQHTHTPTHTLRPCPTLQCRAQPRELLTDSPQQVWPGWGAAPRAAAVSRPRPPRAGSLAVGAPTEHGASAHINAPLR